VSLDGTIEVGGAGTLAHGDDTPLTEDAPFHLGSDTKAMTAVLVATLVEAGELRLDDRVTDLLPDAGVDPSLDHLTLRDVLGHRSGLEPVLDLVSLRAAQDLVAARREAVFDALASPEHEPGSFVYANVNYMLAGVIVEQVTGQPWAQLIQDRVFVPLGMVCGFGAPVGGMAPLGHTANGVPIPQDAAVTDNPPALGPAGTVHCPIRDWAKFVTAVLETLSGRDTAILQASTAADLFADTSGYVAGWGRVDRDGEILYTHDGSNTLWYARATIRPEHGDALLIASNTGEPGAVAAMDELSASFLER
jgi:CubicO group peptidase (beta-lactamase class C family)